MTINKIAKATSLQITVGLTVKVYQNSNYGFLITTKELAKAYGKTSAKVFDARERAIKKGLLIIGKHYLTSEMLASVGLNVDNRSICWTKLGFFEIGKFFKTGNLVEIKKLKQSFNMSDDLDDEFLTSSNETITLSKGDVISLLLEINKISDEALRMGITNLLMGGR